MSRNMWIIVGLVVIGVGAAFAIGFGGRSQSAAQKQYCDSLASLQTSVNSLVALDPSTASQGEFQSDVSSVQSAWSNVASNAQKLHNANSSALNNAWNNFEQAVKSVPGNASADTADGDVASSAKALQSAVNNNINSYNCTNSGSTSTTTTTITTTASST
jgi:hypothetical protein